VSSRTVGLAGLSTAALGGIVVIDRWLITSDAASRSIWVTGVFDGIAHLATAVIILTVTLTARTLAPITVTVVLAASVAVDVDHLPRLLLHDHTVGWNGRPHTHSLVLCLALAIGAAVAPARFRMMLLAAAVGVAVHLGRDVATGPGIPILWPVDDMLVRVDHTVYMSAVCACTAAVVASGLMSWRRTPAVGRR
jgi:inner membrane protein